MSTGGECYKQYCSSPGILDELWQISPTSQTLCPWPLTAAFLFSFFFFVFPFFISNFSFSAMCASLQELALSHCNGHTDWAEYFIQLSSSSQRGKGCYCLTIAFVMIMNVAQSNSSLSTWRLSQLDWLFPETWNLTPKQATVLGKKTKKTFYRTNLEQHQAEVSGVDHSWRRKMKNGDRGGGRMDRGEEQTVWLLRYQFDDKSEWCIWLAAGRKTEQLPSSQLSCKSSLRLNTTMQIRPTVAQIFDNATKPHKASFLTVQG